MKKLLLGALLLCSVTVSLNAQRGFPAKPVVTMTHTTNYPQHVDFVPSMVNKLKVPAGWRVRVAASGLGKPRMLQLGTEGQLYITRRDVGDVLLLSDTDGDHVYDDQKEVVADFKGVHGIAMNNGWMYLVSNRIMKRYPVKTDGTLGAEQVLYQDLPDGGQHPNRTMHFGPDGKLYLSVGSTCNDCGESNKENATLIQIDTTTWVRTIFARGLRNTIGFDFNPANGEIVGMDNGADTKGDDFPGEELNVIGFNKDYGWPYGYGKKTVDQTREDPPGTTKEQYVMNTEASIMEFPAHSAPIEFRFLKDATSLSADWQDDALVCWHGSWNKSKPDGFKVQRIIFENGKPVKSEDFLSGFLDTAKRTRFGRPAGLAIAADGAVYVSDDANGIIYVVEPIAK